MPEITASEIILLRLAANGLTQPFATPQACVEALVGIQSQFTQWAEVSIMNRTTGTTLPLLGELYRRHALINLWAQRHTLHLYTKEDWHILSDLYEARAVTSVSADESDYAAFERLVPRLLTHCREHGAITRAEIQALIATECPESPWFHYFFIRQCCLRGHIFGYPEKPAIKTFMARHRLHPEPWQPDATRTEQALQTLLLRYFRHYGPATLPDFCHWGLPQTAARRALQAAESQLTRHTHAGRDYFSIGAPSPCPDATLLLGKFDPLLVAYRHKDWLIPAAFQKRVWRSAGWVEALIIADGRALGTWRHTLKGRALTLQVEPFAPINATRRKRIATQAEKLASFWEKELTAINYA